MWALDNGKVMGEMGTYKYKSNIIWHISNIVW